ncbi:NUDIX hydrolase [Candidatus Pacearchaeota archaeon]|nr:NUDIX hydrolase [Candidatus Pacearchaeota archaeon]
MALEDYERPSVAADIVIFTIKNEKLKILLIKRGVEPFIDSWALPGGFIKMDEDLDDSAKRELKEETGVTPKYLEQLYTFGDVKRDPRGRVISITYFALIDYEKSQPKLNAKTDAKEAKWFSINDLPELAFDHKKILSYALKRLKWKFEYTAIAFTFLPEKFTFPQLRMLYEIVFSKKFDKRNFRKKILALNILQETNEKITKVSYRPPQLYKLKENISEIIELI